jgi:hypothetical protein
LKQAGQTSEARDTGANEVRRTATRGGSEPPNRRFQIADLRLPRKLRAAVTGDGEMHEMMNWRSQCGTAEEPSQVGQHTGLTKAYLRQNLKALLCASSVSSMAADQRGIATEGTEDTEGTACLMAAGSVVMNINPMMFAARGFSPRRGANDEHIPPWISPQAKLGATNIIAFMFMTT